MSKALIIPIIGILLLFILTIMNNPGSSGGGGTIVDANIGFIDLNDTPNSYSGQAGKIVAVNGGATGLEFVNASSAGDTNWSEINKVIPWQDVNIAQSSLYKANCDNNTLCTITGKITTTRDINAQNIKFGGTLSGGDFNYSLSDANGSQSCPAGQALRSVGSTTACATVNVIADINWSEINKVIPWKDVNISESSLYKANCDNNSLCNFTGHINSVFDANIGGDLNIGDDLIVTDDVNILSDLNVGNNIIGKVLTLTKDPTFGSIIYGDNNTTILIPFNKTTNIFGVQGFPAGTGLSFDVERSAIVTELVDVPSFYVTLSLTILDALIYAKPHTILPSTTDLSGELKFNAIGIRSDGDGNHTYCHNRDLNDWAQCGTRHSVYAPNFLYQSGDFNGNVGIRGGKELRFYGIDKNASIRYKETTDSNILEIKALDFNSGFRVIQKLNTNVDTNTFTIDGNGSIFMPTMQANTGLGVAALRYTVSTGLVAYQASDSDLKTNVQDNPFTASSFCYSLMPKIWNDKSSGNPGWGYLAQEVALLLQQNAIPDWIIIYDNNHKIVGIDYDGLQDFCWKAAIEEHEKFLIAQQQISLISQIICPVGNQNPLCQQLNNTTTPV